MNATPRNLAVKVTTEDEYDPLQLTWAHQWELDTLTGMLMNRINTLTNTVMHNVNTGIVDSPEDVDKSLKSIQGLSIAVRHMVQWPLMYGQPFTFKYDNTYYKVEAVNPVKFEEIERAKNFVPKSLRATQTGL